MEAIFDLFGGHRDDWSQILMTGMLIIMRIVPVIFLTPFLGGKLVPPTTKMGLSFVMAVVVYPYAVGQLDGPLDLNAAAYVVMMLKEVFIGYVLGYLAAEMYHAMDIAGRVLDVMRGSNMAEVQVPELGNRASPLGAFLFQVFLMVFLAVGGHRWFILSLAKSFTMVSIDKFPAMSGGFFEFVDAIMRYVGDLFAIAFALVFPGLFATFMTDVVFGMLNRVAPQLNAYFMAMGIKAMAGIAMLFFALGMTNDQMGVLAAKSVAFIEDIVKMLQ